MSRNRGEEGEVGKEMRSTHINHDEGAIARKRDNLLDYKVKMELFEGEFNLDDGFKETQDPFEE